MRRPVGLREFRTDPVARLPDDPPAPTPERSRRVLRAFERLPGGAVVASVVFLGLVATGSGVALLRVHAEEHERAALEERARSSFDLVRSTFRDLNTLFVVGSALSDALPTDLSAVEELRIALRPQLGPIVSTASVVDVRTLVPLTTVGRPSRILPALGPGERAVLRRVARNGRPDLVKIVDRPGERIVGVVGATQPGQHAVVYAELAVPPLSRLVSGPDVAFRIYFPAVARPENLVFESLSRPIPGAPVVRQRVEIGTLELLTAFSARQPLTSGWLRLGPWLVLVLGLVATAGLAWIAAAAGAARLRAGSLASSLEAKRQELGESEDRYRRLVEEIPLVVYADSADPKPRTLFVSPQVEELAGVSARALVEDPTRWLELVHPDDRAALEQANAEQFRSGTTLELEYRLVRPDGEVRWVRDHSRLDGVGEQRVIRGYWLDVTRRKQLEGRLGRAERLEAVGRLAGGVAHDVNNVLSVIAVSASLLREALPGGDPALAEADAIGRAVDRASQLTRQLLAFSRQQVLRPEVVDVNEVVRSMEPMLVRLFGRQVELVSRLHAEPLQIEVDPGQLEQVLVNLAVNARDAMPAGGTLTIETAPAVADGGEAGVLLVVSDTGIGMDQATVDHAFDPFFTTKGAARGTGLGLATVHGIVDQSRGSITVASAPGLGTVFQIAFPRVTVATPSAADLAPDLPAGAPPGARIALVEDDDALRSPLRRGLELLGFVVVVEAGDGREALGQLGDGVQLDVLVTDVLMPVVGGVELVQAVRVHRPELPVLFLSGYAGDDPALALPLDSRTSFLAKPFTPQALAGALHALLSAATAAPRVV